MQRHKRITTIIPLFFLLLSGGCASDRPPSGSSAERAPLQVVFSDPAPSALNSSPEYIRLSFNHEITARQLIDAIAFTPPISAWELTASGKQAEIKLLTPLEKNRTYILTLNKQLTPNQAHQANQAETFSTPYTLAFSTGPEIDGGTLSGTVVNEAISGAPGSLILAFADKHEAAASQQLKSDAPDYLAQTDDAGKFSFGHLRPGSYRVLAVNDRNHDMRYTQGSEEIGLCSPQLIQTETSGIVLKLEGLESAAGELASCAPLDRERIAISLARPVNTTDFNPEKLEIRQEGTPEPLAINGWYSKNRTMREREFIIVTGGMEAGRRCTIRMKSGGDNAGRGAISFYASGRSPSGRPISASILPENRSEPAYLDKAWPALGKRVTISFSKPVELEVARSMISIEETGAAHSSPLPFSIARIDARTFAVKPEGGFKPGLAYLACVKPGAAKKPIISRFRSALKEESGAISGTCFSRSEQVIVEARAEGSGVCYCSAASPNRNGTFSYTFSELPPGSYTLSAYAPLEKGAADPYRQRNPGSLNPALAAEPFGLHEGKVMVRAAWTTGNIDIHISK